MSKKEITTEQELDQEIGRYDSLIKETMDQFSQFQLDIAEKCSFTDVCNAIVRRILNEDGNPENAGHYCDTFVQMYQDCKTDEVLNPDYRGKPIYGTDWDKLTEKVFNLAYKKMGHRWALIAFLYGYFDTIKVKNAQDQVYSWYVAQDQALTDFYGEEEFEVKKKDDD